MIDAATLEMLVPGSIWVRKTKNGEVPVTVLLITNEGLPEHVLEDHPQQAVFLTQSLKVQSMDLETFLKNRSYASMDTERETLLKALTSEIADAEDEVDVADIDNIQLPDDLTAGHIGADDETDGKDSQGSVSDEVINLNAVGVGTDRDYGIGSGDDGNVVSDNKFYESPEAYDGPTFEIAIDNPLAAQLAASFVSYTEGPVFAGPLEGDTLLTLRFLLGERLTIDNLRDVFAVGGANEISSFAINSDVETTDVQIDNYVNVNLEVTHFGGKRQQFGLVQVTSRGNLRPSAVSNEVQQVLKQEPVAEVKEEQTVDLTALPAEVATPVEVKVETPPVAPSPSNTLNVTTA